MHAEAMLALRVHGMPMGFAPQSVGVLEAADRKPSTNEMQKAALSVFSTGQLPPSAQPLASALLHGDLRPLPTLKAADLVIATTSGKGIGAAAMFRHAGVIATAEALAKQQAVARKERQQQQQAGGGGSGSVQQQLGGAKRGPGRPRLSESGASGASDGDGKKRRRRSEAGAGDAGTASLPSSTPAKAKAAAAGAPPAGKGASSSSSSSSSKKAPAADDSQPGPDEEEVAADDEDDKEDGPDDGNTDYCGVCEEAGDLLCCDCCPRSYHTACLRINGDDLPEGDWLCPECVKAFGPHKERAGSVDGPVVTAPFFDGPAFTAPKATAGGREAELLAFLRALADHEFAASFCDPVPPSLKAYHRAIPRSCDLGTLLARLEGKAKWGGPGSARDAYKAGVPELTAGFYYGRGGEWDAPRALTDVRLVWANCRAFNRPHSTIWRMAEVLARETETALRDRFALSAAEAESLRTMRLAECSLANMHKDA